jgi:hypothetical protein
VADGPVVWTLFTFKIGCGGQSTVVGVVTAQDTRGLVALTVGFNPVRGARFLRCDLA